MQQRLPPGNQKPEALHLFKLPENLPHLRGGQVHGTRRSEIAVKTSQVASIGNLKLKISERGDRTGFHGNLSWPGFPGTPLEYPFIQAIFDELRILRPGLRNPGLRAAEEKLKSVLIDFEKGVRIRLVDCRSFELPEKNAVPQSQPGEHR